MMLFINSNFLYIYIFQWSNCYDTIFNNFHIVSSKADFTPFTLLLLNTLNILILLMAFMQFYFIYIIKRIILSPHLANDFSQ